MGYIDETLMADERIIYRTKPHWIIFTPVLGWLILALLITFIGPRYDLGTVKFHGNYTLVDIFAGLAFIIALLSALFTFITYQTSEFGITNKRVLMKVGFIRRSTLEILLQKIESIQVSQTVLGRILNYGLIIVSGVGGSRDPFQNIPNPLVFRRYAQEQLEKTLRR
jgi:uncharacterized membrane protein YdbT with pleckstrin-like domain